MKNLWDKMEREFILKKKIYLRGKRKREDFREVVYERVKGVGRGIYGKLIEFEREKQSHVGLW